MIVKELKKPTTMMNKIAIIALILISIISGAAASGQQRRDITAA